MEWLEAALWYAMATFGLGALILNTVLQLMHGSPARPKAMQTWRVVVDETVRVSPAMQAWQDTVMDRMRVSRLTAIEELAMQTYQGMPLAASVEEHLHNLQVYGESVYFMPAGFYGHGDETAIPDTPLEEWNAKVDELLKECEEHNLFFAL